MEILINNENLKTDKVAVLLHFTMGIQSGKSLENEKMNLTLVTGPFQRHRRQLYKIGAN